MKKANIIIGLLIIANTLGFAQMPLNDTHIGDAIENEYRFDHAVNVNKVDVRVIDGIVELTGSVDNLKAKERAAKIAQLVKGVRSVSNRIKVEPPVVYSDAGIKHNVETALFQDPATDLYELNVSVTDKVVTLSGTVDSYQEKSLSEDVAKSVKGVVELNNAIDITYKVNRPDLEIKADIEQALKWNVQVDDGLIEVEVNKGEVTLNGVVGSAAEKKIALYSSWVAGVSSVNNQLRVHYPYGYYWYGYYPFYDIFHSPLTHVGNLIPDDELIAKHVEDEIWWSPYVDKDQVTITVNNGEVTLEGHVDSWKEYQKAAENAWEGGAWSVNNMLQVVE